MTQLWRGPLHAGLEVLDRERPAPSWAAANVVLAAGAIFSLGALCGMLVAGRWERGGAAQRLRVLSRAAARYK